MVAVDAKLIESVGYAEPARKLYVKFRASRTVCLDDVPRFRFSGLMAAPRKDAYYNTYLKDRFLTKEVAPAPI